MINILLIVHIVISILLVIVIMLQKSGSDGMISSGASGGTGVVSAKAAANFLTKTTTVLGAVFMGMSILLANLSHKVSVISNHKLEEEIKKEEAEATPVTKEEGPTSTVE